MKLVFKKIRTIAIAILFISSTVLLPSCEKATLEDIINIIVEVNNGLGWLEEDENLDELEEDIDIDDDDANLPDRVDLSDKFPPIGNQGSYGTCVTWSVGYNIRTFLEGVDQGYSPSQLADPSHQFSPKDLFWAIPSSDKGADCNGTGFEPAFDAMVSRGVATLSDVPYVDLGGCSQSPPSSWNSAANNYKIENYRKIEHTSVAEIKDYLREGRAISFGAKLGDDFMGWNTDDIISSDTYLNPGMQHAYHAMALCGYDNSKGANGAFRVVNSWGTTWGDNGYIWIDYHFFINDFAFCAFVAKSKNTSYSMPGNTASTYDLVGWSLEDAHDTTDYGSGDDPLNRMCSYNVYNVGNSEITADKDWSILYLYYNAYDANDYGIILYDYYSDDYGSFGEDGDMSDVGGDELGQSGNWYNYINVGADQSVADALYGGSDNYFEFSYTMPNTLNGSYYLVMIADGFDVIEEYDEANNNIYYTKQNGDPFNIIGGVIQDDDNVKKSRSNNFNKTPYYHAKSPYSSVKTRENVNTYTTAEITQMIMSHKKSGKLQEKMTEYVSRGGKINVKRANRR